MTKYFVDTWFLIARLARDDEHHNAARGIERRHPSAMLVTHDAVLTEFLAYFSSEGAAMRVAASGIARNLMGTVEVLHADRPLFLRALARYERRPDKEYSLVDCMSMIVMEERGITHVLTNDRHFTQAGFTVVSQ